jgi:DMSO/TMAO reductase YedYZ molybdopterin-dependent catalytic subunit
VFSIGELDPALSRSEILVADTVDGGPLTAAQGPLRLVVPKDTRGARGVRMLQRLDVVRVKR